MENLQHFLELKEKWVTWEDKEKYLQPYLDNILAKLECRKPDPSMKQEEDLLKEICDDLNQDFCKEHAKMDVLMKTYFSSLKEIYKMPGCIEELEVLLESHPAIQAYEKRMITQTWCKQYSVDMRDLKTNSPMSEKEIEEKHDFLKSKCVEIDEANTKMCQVAFEMSKVDSLLQSAKHCLYLTSRLPDNEYGSSSSRKKFSSREKLRGIKTRRLDRRSSSEEDSSSSSRKKRKFGEDSSSSS